MIAIIKLLLEWAAPFYTKNVSLLPHAHVCNDRKWCSLALENEAILSCKATQVLKNPRGLQFFKSLKTFGHFLFFSKEFVRGRFLSSTFFMATGMHGKLVVQHHHPFFAIPSWQRHPSEWINETKYSFHQIHEWKDEEKESWEDIR